MGCGASSAKRGACADVAMVPEAPADKSCQSAGFEAPKLPSWLNTEGPGQLQIPAASWAMSINQLIGVIKDMRETPQYQKLKSDHGSVNMYLLVEHFLKPWTQGSGRSIALHANPSGMAAQAIASHAWAENNEEFEDAILQFQEQHQLSGDISFWVCTFSMYQGNDTPTIADQIAIDPFSQVISSDSVAKGPGLVALHVQSANLYERLWCPFEMNQATVAEVNVEVAASSLYTSDLLKTYQYFVDKIAGGDEEKAFQMFCKRKLTVQTSTAQCSNPDDATMIRNKIVKDGGFDLLDEIISEVRQRLAQKVLAQQRELEKEKVNAKRELVEVEITVRALASDCDMDTAGSKLCEMLSKRPKDVHLHVLRSICQFLSSQLSLSTHALHQAAKLAEPGSTTDQFAEAVVLAGQSCHSTESGSVRCKVQRLEKIREDLSQRAESSESASIEMIILDLLYLMLVTMRGMIMPHLTESDEAFGRNPCDHLQLLQTHHPDWAVVNLLQLQLVETHGDHTGTAMLEATQQGLQLFPKAVGIKIAHCRSLVKVGRISEGEEQLNALLKNKDSSVDCVAARLVLADIAISKKEEHVRITQMMFAVSDSIPKARQMWYLENHGRSLANAGICQEAMKIWRFCLNNGEGIESEHAAQAACAGLAALVTWHAMGEAPEENLRSWVDKALDGIDGDPELKELCSLRLQWLDIKGRQDPAELAAFAARPHRCSVTSALLDLDLGQPAMHKCGDGDGRNPML